MFSILPTLLISGIKSVFLYAYRDEERGKEEGRKRYFEKSKAMTSQLTVSK